MTERAINPYNILPAICLLAIAGFVVWYSFYQSRTLVAGPEIAFASPKNATVVEESPITVTGSAERISFLELNGRRIYIDQTGSFEEKLPLLPGHNIIRLQAEDRFGRITTEELYLLYEGE